MDLQSAQFQSRASSVKRYMRLSDLKYLVYKLE